MNIDMTSQLLAGIAGVVISLVFMMLPLIPAWNKKWNTFSGERKQATNMLALVVVTLSVALLSCLTDIILIECTQLGIMNLVLMFVSAALGNTTAYTTTNRILGQYIHKRVNVGA